MTGYRFLLAAVFVAALTSGAAWAQNASFPQSANGAPISNSNPLPVSDPANTTSTPAYASLVVGGAIAGGPSLPLRTDPTGTTTQPVSASSLPLPTNASQETGGNLAQLVTDSGAPGATACATDTSSCNFNQLLQRLAQRLTTINATLNSPMQATGGTVGLAAGTAVVGKVGIDQTTPGTTNLVSAGFAQQVADTPTVTASAYASGNCIGGFRSVTVTVNNGQSGLVSSFRVVSAGGSTPTVWVYLFGSNPSSSTCTDKGTFTLATADIDKMIASPTATTLTVPIGATAAVGSVDYTPPRSFVAGGSTGSGVQTIYYALVSASVFTPSSTSDIHTRVGVVLN